MWKFKYGIIKYIEEMKFIYNFILRNINGFL